MFLFTMSNDLPLIGFDHAFYSDVIMPLVYFNNLRLRYGYLILFDNTQCGPIARCHN